jgi:hypothetical protein
VSSSRDENQGLSDGHRAWNVILLDFVGKASIGRTGCVRSARASPVLITDWYPMRSNSQLTGCFQCSRTSLPGFLRAMTCVVNVVESVRLEDR